MDAGGLSQLSWLSGPNRASALEPGLLLPLNLKQSSSLDTDVVKRGLVFGEGTDLSGCRSRSWPACRRFSPARLSWGAALRSRCASESGTVAGPAVRSRTVPPHEPKTCPDALGGWAPAQLRSSTGTDWRWDRADKQAVQRTLRPPSSLVSLPSLWSAPQTSHAPNILDQCQSSVGGVKR